MINNRVLGFWFKGLWSNGKWIHPSTDAVPSECMKRWFNSTPSFNQEVRELFEADIVSVLNTPIEHLLTTLSSEHVFLLWITL